MRLATLRDRLCVVRPDGALDLSTISGGALPTDPSEAWAQWDEVSTWLASHTAELEAAETQPFAPEELGAPVSAPRQVFAIGLNYSLRASLRPSPWAA